MKKFSVVLAAVVLLGFLLAWNPGFSEAAVRVQSGAQDPAQLATASILPVKVSSNTDTILILYRDSADTTTATGSAGDLKLTFYTTACAKGNDVTVNLTRGDVDIGDETSRFFVSSLFVTTASGVILGEPVTPASYEPRWGMSGLVVDGDIGALYERQGYPALVRQNVTAGSGTGANDSVWAGFSTANFEDYYLYGSSFTTTVQLVCPDGALDTAMDVIAPIAGTLGAAVYEIPAINVYNRTEVLINSLHDKTCSCFTENPGAIATIMALNSDVLGVFSIDMNSSQDATGSRVIVLETSAGNVYVDGRIRRATSTTLATP